MFIPHRQHQPGCAKEKPRDHPNNFSSVDRETEIKDWTRSKKIELLESMNPRWDNLAKGWANEYKPEPAADQREIPRPAGETAGPRDDAHID
jgi:hypothetical protein